MGDRPFIPRDKPKSWVIFVLSALCGLGFGLVAFVSASQGWSVAKAIGIAGFSLCWLSAAIAGINCGIGMLTGKYGHLQERAWRDQVW